MGPSPFWAHIGWGNAGPGEVSSKQTLAGAGQTLSPPFRLLLSLSLSLSLSSLPCLTHRRMGEKCIASLTELVGLGPCPPLPSLPDGQHFGPHREGERERARERERKRESVLVMMRPRLLATRLSRLQIRAWIATALWAAGTSLLKSLGC